MSFFPSGHSAFNLNNFSSPPFPFVFVLPNLFRFLPNVFPFSFLPHILPLFSRLVPHHAPQSCYQSAHVFHIFFLQFDVSVGVDNPRTMGTRCHEPALENIQQKFCHIWAECMHSLPFVGRLLL